MNKKQLEEILKYSNPKELYIIAWNNILRQIFCPFRVVVLHDIGRLEQGTIHEVEAVMVTMELKTVFFIKGQYYYYYHFNILLD